jgi:hypothetical protein
MKMKIIRCLALLFLVGLIGSVTSKAIDEEDPEESDELDDEEPVIALNPAYVEPHNSDIRRSSNSSDDEEEGKESANAKTVLGKALAKSRVTKRKTLKLIQKHHTKVLAAMLFIVFRREIGKFLFHVLATPQVDPKTGQITGREIRLHPTAILKVVLFVEIMRRVQQGSKPARLAAVMMAGNANPFLGAFMSKLLSPSNSAFIPPIEQHFTFERMNERYVKDGMAFDKAMTSIITPQPFFSSGSTPLSWTKNALPSAYNKIRQNSNETVIILDLSGLDTRVSQLSALRDEISFLLSQHRAHAAQPTGAASNSTADSNEVTMEVIVLLESPGGAAQDYGLAAQQLLRLRNEGGIRVTICVDKVAASGGS